MLQLRDHMLKNNLYNFRLLGQDQSYKYMQLSLRLHSLPHSVACQNNSCHNRHSDLSHQNKFTFSSRTKGRFCLWVRLIRNCPEVQDTHQKTTMRFSLDFVRNFIPKATVAAFKYGHKKKRAVKQFSFRLGLKPRQDF